MNKCETKICDKCRERIRHIHLVIARCGCATKNLCKDCADKEILKKIHELY